MIVSTQQQNKLHPHKFIMWVSISSIVMLFAALTSAYIVKSGQAGWHEVKTPKVFLYSSGVMLLSSLTMQAALRSFKHRSMAAFRSLLLITLLLGAAFVVMQFKGFEWLWERGVHFEGSSGAGQFLYIIFGLHGLHVIGGLIALLILFFKQYVGRSKNYNATPIEIMSTYWHFVDVLWIYLFVFFIWIG